MTTPNTAGGLQEIIEALKDLRTGVELDKHNAPNAATKLAGLDLAIAALRAAPAAAGVLDGRSSAARTAGNRLDVLLRAVEKYGKASLTLGGSPLSKREYYDAQTRRDLAWKEAETVAESMAEDLLMLAPEQREAPAEVERLRGEVEALRYDAGTSASVAGTLMAENERLRAERDASAQPVAWVAADTLNSPHPTCISSLAYMSQLDRERGREYVPLYAAPVAAQTADDTRDAERYRWLRDQTETDGIAIVMKNKHFDESSTCAENIDKFIDAAIAATDAQPQGEGGR